MVDRIKNSVGSQVNTSEGVSNCPEANERQSDEHLNLQSDQFLTTAVHRKASSFKGTDRTPQFIKSMMDYCLSEIRGSVESKSLIDYIESLEDLVSQLGSPDYPLSQVSVIDRVLLIQALDLMNTEMIQVFGHESTELDQSNRMITELKKRLGAQKKSKSALLEIHDRTAYWSDKANWGKRIVFDPESTVVCDELCQHVPALKAYEVSKIERDGGCWTRSLWHATFAQLNTKAKATEFINKISQSPTDFMSEDDFFENNDLSDVVALVTVLCNMSASERIDAFCHEKVDLTLQMYMRKIVVALLSREDKEKSELSTQYIQKIALPTTFGGAHEINCFTHYFGIAIQELAVVFKDGKRVLQRHTYGTSEKGSIDEKSLDKVIMYGSSPIHYDVLIRK